MNAPSGFTAKFSLGGEKHTTSDPQLLLDIPTCTGAKRRYLTVPTTTAKRLTRVGGRPGVGIPRPKSDASTWTTGQTVEIPGRDGEWQVWSHGPRTDEYWLVGSDARQRPILVNRRTGEVLDEWTQRDSELALRLGGRTPLRARDVVQLGFDLDSVLIHRITGDRLTVRDVTTCGTTTNVTLVDEHNAREVMPLAIVKNTYRPDGPPQVGMRVANRITRRVSVVHEVRDDGRIALANGRYYPDAASFWGVWQ